MSITIHRNKLCYFHNEQDGIRNINYFLVPHTLQECYLASSFTDLQNVHLATQIVSVFAVKTKPTLVRTSLITHLSISSVTSELVFSTQKATRHLNVEIF